MSSPSQDGVPSSARVAAPTQPRAAHAFQAHSDGSVKSLVEKEFGAGSIMLRVAFAESRFDPAAKNSRSTAKGVFQILDGTWSNYHCTGNPYNASDNIRCARKLYDAEGTKPWNSSKGMW